MFCSEKVMAFASGSSKSIFGFDPRSIPGCQSWLDAADATTITYSSGSNLSLWRDKAPYGNNARPLQGTPIVRVGINGLPAVYLDGVAALTITCPPNVTNQVTAFAVFTVESGTAGSGRLITLSYPDYQNPFSAALILYNTTSNTLTHERNGVGYNATSNILTFGVPSLASTTINGASTQMHLNGTQVMNVSTIDAKFGYTYYTIGCFAQARGVNDNGVGPWNGYTWKGYLGEAILYSNTLSVAQRQQVEGYLSKKWILGSSTPAFTSPTTISGCQLWLDGKDTASSGTGSTLTTWFDKSGLSRNATANTAITVGNTLNGYRALTFTGGQWLTGSISITGATMTVFTVFYVDSNIGTFGRVAAFAVAGQNDYNNNGYFSLVRSGPNVGPYRNGVTAFSSTPYQLPLVHTTYFDGTNEYAYTNGGTVSSNAVSGNFSISGYAVGKNTFTGDTGEVTFYGSIGELIVYNTALTATERQKVEYYLAQKWGFVAPAYNNGPPVVSLAAGPVIPYLPPTQPFYGTRPFSRDFQPPDIDGCVMWLDAADASTLTLSGSNVTQWVDKSGTGNTMTPYSTYSNATVSTAFQGGLNVLNFSGTALYKAPASSAVYPVDAYIILALKDTTTVVSPLAITTNSGTDNFNGLDFSEYTASRWHNGSTNFSRTPNTVSPSNETSTSFLLINWSIANSNYVIRRNGVQLSQTNSYTWTMTAGSIFQVGYIQSTVLAPSPGFGWFRGYIGEIVAFSNQLGTAQRQQVETYLIRKWNIALPSPGVSPTAPSFSLTNCKLWLDGADVLGTGAPTPTTITTWADKSGTGNTVTSAGAQAIAGSQMGAFFPGASYFSITGGLVNSISNVPFVIFCVDTPAANMPGAYFLMGNDNANSPVNNALHIGYRDSNDFTFAFYANDLEVTAIPPAPFVNGVTRVWAFYLPTSSNRNVRLNGSLVATHTNSTRLGRFDAPVIGRVFGTYNEAYYGTISEVLIYNADIGLEAIQSIESYLMAKWQPGTLIPKYTIPSDTALPFGPLQVGGCALWLDAADATQVTFVSGSNVSTWKDKSTSALTASYGGTAPTYTTFNGLPSVYLTGASSLTTGTLPAASLDSTGITLFTVATPVSSGSGQAVIIASVVPEKVIRYEGSLTLSTYTINNGTQRASYNGVSQLANVTSIKCITDTAAAFNLYENGVNTYSNTTAVTYQPQTTSTTYVLGRWNTSFYFTGHVHEVLVYNTSLTTTQRQLVEGYLAWKWKLRQSLPDTHQYKLRPPPQVFFSPPVPVVVGITVAGTNTAANMSGAANGIGGFSGVDDGFGSFTLSPAMTLFGTSRGTGYPGTNGYISFTTGTGQIFNSPNAATPNGGPAMQMRPYDARGNTASFASGTSATTTTAQFTRLVASYYPRYTANVGNVGVEIFFVRDVTNSKQFIWMKVDTNYNLNGNPETNWGFTSGSAYVGSTAFPGAGGSVVYDSDLTGNTWTKTMPGSLVNF